jgi:hypothetical protein
MKKTLTALLVLVTFAFPLQSYAAVAFGGALGSARTGGISTQCITGMTIAGSDRLFILTAYTETLKTLTNVFIDNGAGGGTQNLTQIGSYQDAEASNHRVSNWYVIAPSTSNTRVCVSLTSGTDVIDLGAVYYTGVDQVTPFTTAQQVNDNASPRNQQDTSDRDGSWQWGAFFSVSSLTSITGGTSRQTAGLSTHVLIDSNATVASGATNTFDIVFGGNSVTTSAMIRPVAVAVAAAPAEDFVYLSDE